MQHDSPTPNMPDAEILNTQSDTSAACKHEEVCARTEHKPGLGYCILHDPDMEKDREAFDTALAEHRAMLEERREEAKREEGDDYEPRRELQDDFRWMIFPDEVSFAGKTFPQEGADFLHVTFGGSVSFTYCNFDGQAFFQFTEFESRAAFEGVIFVGNVNFSSACFRDEVSFGDGFIKHGTNFGEEANFRKCRFCKGIVMNSSEFGSGADFQEAVFDDRVSFLASNFGDRANFRRAKFNGKTTFQGCKFGDKVKFGDAYFSKGACFEESHFGASVDFQQVKLLRPSNLASCTFGEDVNFSRGLFWDVDFGGSIFGSNSRFEEIYTKGYLVFRNVKFLGRLSFEGGKSRLLFQEETVGFEAVDFTRAEFVEPSRVRFRNVDFSHVELLHTDIRDVEFTNVKWSEIDGGNGVYDELAAQESASKLPYAALARLYRRLKQNYEDNRDYGRGGDFHFREKEMMRRNPATPLRDRIVLSIYHAVSGYGERYWAGGWFIAVLVACSLLSISLGLSYAESSSTEWMLRWRLDDFFRSLVYSLQVAFVRPPDYFHVATLWGKAVQVATMILGPILLALFGLAVRQRMRR